MERDIALAWQTEFFARTKRLKPLRDYLRSTKPDPTRGAANLLAMLKGMKRKGIRMDIKKIKLQPGGTPSL